MGINKFSNHIYIVVQILKNKKQANCISFIVELKILFQLGADIPWKRNCENRIFRKSKDNHFKIRLRNW